MEEKTLFLVSEVCKYHQTTISFIHQLRDNELIEITTIKEEEFLDENALTQTEQFIRLHHDLSLNMDALEVVSHLLEKIKTMQNEMQELRNQLKASEELL